MDFPKNNQIFENYQRGNEDPDAPEGFYDTYLERNSFNLLQDNVENNHEIEQEQAADLTKRMPNICRTTWLMEKPSIN